MLSDGFFGVALHVRVDRGVDAQAVGVDVVGRAVFLKVLITPSEERISFPCQRIVMIFLVLPGCIIGANGSLGCQHMAQIFAQVGGKAFFVGNTLEVEAQRHFTIPLVVGIGQIALLVHQF